MKSIIILLTLISSCYSLFTTIRPKYRSTTISSGILFSSSLHNDIIIRNNTDASSFTETTRSTTSPSAMWHRNRRKQMIQKYASQIIPLEQQSHGLFVGLPLLILSNISLVFMAIRCSTNMSQLLLFALFPGSILSLWQLQILHDVLHSSLLPKPSYRNPSKSMRFVIKHRRKIQNNILFWGSMPSAFGYYLYLQYGHLTHHKNHGGGEVSLATLFNSTQKDFEDGDILFTAHRMKLLGDVGPTFSFGKQNVTMSISKAGFSLWREGCALRNAIAFTLSFLFERCLLIINDFVVAITGKNFFFPNKPQEFHREAATYCRMAVMVRLVLCFAAKSWRPLLFLALVETLWSIPPHPACAMFITNHGSEKSDDGCIPSSSTYAGSWYSFLTLGTNYHVEHHDFPTIPLHKLWKLRNEIAPEYYRIQGNDNLYGIMRKTFRKPDFYSCMNANVITP
mmetsp:Transcript_17592/g.26665  ORF Transcript_17592/g.26665 Transcript_17592/m.26665 type:complete len:452 (+) Transcript_17592:113-1468(+)